GPLDDMLAADSEIPPSDFYDYAKETVDNQVYGLAWFISGWLHWYNKNAIKAAGATEPKALNADGKWDYDAWYQFAKQFTSEQGGAPVYGYDMNSTRSATVNIMLAWAYGTEYWNEDFSKSLMDSPENIKVWTWLQQFYKEALTPKPPAAQEQ